MRFLRRKTSAAVLAAMAVTLGFGGYASRALADGQPKKKDSPKFIKPAEVTYKTQVEPPQARPGDTVTYSVTATVAAPWHIYAFVDKQPEDGPRGTQFDFFDLAGLSPQGKWTSTRQANEKLDPAFNNMKVQYHDDEVTWQIKLKVPADAKPGKKTLRNQIYFQICDPKSCKPPVNVTVPDADVTVVSDKSALAPKGSSFLPALLVATTNRMGSGPAKKDSPKIVVPSQADFQASVEPANAKPGDTVTYSVKAAIDAPWHIYAFVDEQPKEGPRGTQFDFFDRAGLEPVGTWSADRPAIEKVEAIFGGLKVQFHDEEVIWQIKLKVPADAEPGIRTLRNQVAFQICDPKSCSPLVRVTVPDATLTIGSEKSKPIAMDRAAFAALLVGFADSAATATAVTPVPPSELDKVTGGGLASFLVYSALGGLFAVLMPCVWPMIPITVNFFVKQGEAKHGSPTKLAIVYCLAIIGIFTGIGLAVTAALGATGATQLGANKWVNLLFGLAFIGLGLSLLGLFEIRLPTALLNASSQAEGKGGLLGVMFMATTLTITSFTCTAPVVGTLLVASTKGQYFYPVLGLLTFSAVMAMPFFVLALMPGLMRKMPRSGDWMNAVKVVGGLVEIALAFKFLNTAEIGFGAASSEAWIDAQLVLTVWVITALACGIYLLGLFRTDHDHDAIRVGPLRMVSGIAFLCVALFLAPALFGVPPKSRFYEAIVGILPPDVGELNKQQKTVQEIVAQLSDLQSFRPTQVAAAPGALPVEEEIRGPVAAKSTDPKVAIREERKFHGVSWGMSYEAALEEAKAKNKLVLIDFTGVFCANCRTVEQKVMPRPDTVAEMKKFVTVSLYTDKVDIKSISPDARDELALANLELEVNLVQESTSPVYAVVSPDGKLLGKTSYQQDENFLRDFLRSMYEKHAPKAQVAQKD